MTPILHPFDYSKNFKTFNARTNPEQYQVGKGEQGVLLVEPYKSEILPHWKFRIPAIAALSAKKIYHMFLAYKRQNDFVGMDMARKFLQMGYTRSRRYANHPSGKKYVTNPQKKKTLKARAKARIAIHPQAPNWNTNDKAESARIFYHYYAKANSNAVYQALKLSHRQRFG